MASNFNSNSAPNQSSTTKQTNFEQMDKTTSNTLKRNPKMELNKTDLLKLLSCLEGELQARDIVIATLKSERVKQLLNTRSLLNLPYNDPHAALQRDSFATSENKIDEAGIRAVVNQQTASLDNLILQYKKSQLRMQMILKEAEERHRKVVQELEEEKKKHEHDTAQGDDITYGLEKERTRLKQELEIEKQNKKKLEKDLKKASETLEEERTRQKTIIFMLLSERKKYFLKYNEEQKRSEDLAQILTEEKSRIDSMAEGLEEESKKSLQMEAELEKHLAQFDTERQQLRAALSKEDKRCKELEGELEKAKTEIESLKKELNEAHQVAMFQASTSSISPPRAVLPRSPLVGGPPQPPAKPAIIPLQNSVRPPQPTTDSISPPSTGAGTPMISSVAKVVQPTATVSSVPVCGPTTGIARSVSPGQSLRNIVYSPTASSESRSAISTWSSSNSPQSLTEQTPTQTSTEKRPNQTQVVQVTPRVSLSASPGTKVFTTTQGGKVTFHVTTNASSNENTSQNLTKKIATPVRGVPPPVPPNKPVIPPKKENVTARRTDINEDTKSKPPSTSSQGVKFGITISKEKIHVPSLGSGEAMESRREPQVGCPQANNYESDACVNMHEPRDLETLNQELADFQQLLVSMANTKRS